jgi:hypothetical protein
MSLGLSLVKKPAPVDIEDARRQLRLAMGNLMFERAFGLTLMKAYNRALDEAN